MAENLLDRISAMSAELSKSERRVAQAILDDPKQVLAENLSLLAKRAQVSEPTVFRFCKHFGATGFPDFKLALGSTLSSENTQSRERVRSGDSVDDIVDKVLSNNISLLKELSRKLDTTVLARCIDVISQSRRLIVVGQGLSKFQAQAFSARLLQLGMPCESYADPALMYPCCASLRPGEVLLLLSASGYNRDLIKAATICQQNAVTVVGLCPEFSTLAPLCTLVLKCGEGARLFADPHADNRLAQFCLLEILASGIALRRADIVRDLRPRLESALRETYVVHEEDLSTAESQPQPQETELKPGEPISALNWPL
ncbi:MAG: MurR/RpiR family transcriptional regulator [Succinivibrio sp.]|nr:MurR/RpiR family transcriptional regulator [Succinivibrio sp.]